MNDKEVDDILSKITVDLTVKETGDLINLIRYHRSLLIAKLLLSPKEETK